jgi:hypothetical protein
MPDGQDSISGTSMNFSANAVKLCEGAWAWSWPLNLQQTIISPYTFMAWLLIQHRSNFILQV